MLPTQSQRVTHARFGRVGIWNFINFSLFARDAQVSVKNQMVYFFEIMESRNVLFYRISENYKRPSGNTSGFRPALDKRISDITPYGRFM